MKKEYDLKRFGNNIMVTIHCGGEIIKVLSEIAKKEKIGFATINGVGAYSNIIVGAFNSDKCSFLKHNMTPKKGWTYEVLHLTGNITWTPDTLEPIIHCHTSFSGNDALVYGGHLFKGIVGVTFEIHIIELTKEKHYRKWDENFAFKFWDLENANNQQKVITKEKVRLYWKNNKNFNCPI